MRNAAPFSVAAFLLYRSRVNEALKSLGFALVTLLVALGCSSLPHGEAGRGDGDGRLVASDAMRGTPTIERSTLTGKAENAFGSNGSLSPRGRGADAPP